MTTTQIADQNTLARLEALYRANVRRVHGFAYHRVGADSAVDVVSEVFHAAALAARDGRIEDVTTAWLMAVARNKIADHWRRAYRRRARRLLASVRTEDFVSFPEGWHEDPRRPAVVAALDRIRDHERALLMLHHVDGMTVADLADMTGKSVSATESALARARRSFRRVYDGGDA